MMWRLEHSAPEYSNVNMVEFATASGAKLGHHRIVIRSIEFEGSYISAESLFLILLFILGRYGHCVLTFRVTSIKKAHGDCREETQSPKEREPSIERTEL